MLPRVALVRTDVSEESTVSIIRVTVDGLRATLAITINLRLLVTNRNKYQRERAKKFVGSRASPVREANYFAAICEWTV
jgi:hypothetical protein